MEGCLLRLPLSIPAAKALKRSLSAKAVPLSQPGRREIPSVLSKWCRKSDNIHGRYQSRPVSWCFVLPINMQNYLLKQQQINRSGYLLFSQLQQPSCNIGNLMDKTLWWSFTYWNDCMSISYVAVPRPSNGEKRFPSGPKTARWSSLKLRACVNPLSSS